MRDNAPTYSLRHRLEAGLARAVFAVLSRLPARVVSGFGGWLGRRVAPFAGARRTAERNLAHALPEYDAKARAQIVRQAFDNFGRTMVEYAALAKIARDPGRIEVEGHEQLALMAAQGRPAMLFCAHLGNWEVIPPALARLSKPLTIVYRPANNPLVDRMIAELRAPFTAGMAPKGAMGARQMLKALSAGEHVIMVVDQKLNTGMEIPFFGRGAFTGDAVARFAMRFDCPVFPVRTERLEDGRFKVTVEEPFHFPAHGTDNDVREALVRINKRLEDWIRQRPGQWLWMHKRWPA